MIPREIVRRAAVAACRMAFAVALAVALVPAGSVAQPTAATAEIDHLLSFIGAAHCEFFRNGTWYTATQAQQHLREKLGLLSTTARIWTAEEFIEKVATKSAFTNLRYQVRCAGNETAAVDDWLREELKRYRQRAAAADSGASRDLRDAPDSAAQIRRACQSSCRMVIRLWTSLTPSVSRAIETALSAAS